MQHQFNPKGIRIGSVGPILCRICVTFLAKRIVFVFDNDQPLFLTPNTQIAENEVIGNSSNKITGTFVSSALCLLCTFPYRPLH